MIFKFIFVKKSQIIKAIFLCLLSSQILITMPAAHADDKDTLNFIAGISRQYDNNLFRAHSLEQSDNITTSYAGVRIDKPYSLQRFKLEFTVTDYKYQNNDFLDFKAEDYKAAWLWSTTPYLTGVLSADRKQQLNDFRDFRTFTVQNIRTNENQHFEADFSPHGTWHLLGGFTRTDSSNSLAFNAEADSTSNALDAGLKYSFASGSAITFMGHERNGQFSNRKLNSNSLLDTGFDETEIEAKLDWILSGKSKLNMQLAHIKREHDHFSQRDYSGEQGRIDYTWTPTGKLQLVASVSRRLSNFQLDDCNFTRTDSLNFTPIFSITSKITARANASISERTFLGDAVLLSSGRIDKERMLSVSVDWAPYRSVTFGANVQRSSRNSNQSALLDFEDTSAGLSANLYF